MDQNEMAGYAYNTVPFYQDRAERKSVDFEDIPVVTKDEMIRNQGKNIAPAYMMDYLRGNLQVFMTSGSTGKCMEIIWDPSQVTRSLLSLWHLRKRYYGISPRDRYCYFFTTKVENGIVFETERLPYGMGFSKLGLSENRLVQIYKEMLNYDPVWFFGQPSMVLLLIHTAETHALPVLPSLRYIELTGERIAHGVRERIREFFHCSVASQYGCYEVNSIAYECPYGHKHIMDKNVYVEVLDESDHPVWEQEGAVTLTSLQNQVMPFVRYRIGDRGILHKPSSCACGNKAPFIELTMARENDLVINRDGSRVHSDLFAHAVEMVNLVSGSIIQYQIIQTDYERFEIRFVLDEDEDREEVISLFMEALGTFTKDREFEFLFPKELFPHEATGKCAWFISKKERYI